MAFKISNFQPVPYERTISESCPLVCMEPSFPLVLTKLIQEAGQHCEHYASDLWIDWAKVLRDVSDPEFGGGVYLFGFRDMGIDHTEFVLARGYTDQYRAIWRLDVTVDAGHRNAKMTLTRVGLRREG